MTDNSSSKNDRIGIGDKVVDVLLIEDNPGDARLILEFLSGVECTIIDLHHADRLSAGLDQLAEGSIDVVLLDLGLPDSQGLETLRRVSDHFPGLPIVVLTGFTDEELGVQAIHEGAQDYLIKGHVDERLLVCSIRYAIERKRAEEELKSSQEYSKSLIDSSLDMIIAVDKERKITQFNKAAQETFGYQPEEVLGKHINILYADPETGMEVHKQAVEKGRTVKEILNRRKNGEIFPSLLSASPLYDSNGERVGVMGVSRDITERKKAERALKEAKERAEASDRLKNVFLSTMSHEVRTPLNVVLGYTDLLSTELKSQATDEVRRMLESIQESSNRLKHLIDDILDISLIEADRIELELKLLPGDDLIKKCVGEILVIARQKNLKVVESFRAPQAQINVDKLRLQQAIGNILQNAVKYTREGSINISTQISDGEYQITVKDTGIGIKDEFKPHLFSLFRQEDEGYGRSYEGVGLGLAISHRLVAAMEGRIEVDSKKGEGSTFKLILPVQMKPEAVVEEEAIEIEPEEPLPILQEEEVKKGKVLILEDNSPNLNYMEFLMSRLGLDYLSAMSGEEALDLLKEQDVHCMLIDVSLAEGMSGIEFLKIIEKEKKYETVPKVAVTAHAMKGQREEYLREGFDDYLAKPFTLSDLKEILDRNLLIRINVKEKANKLSSNS